MLLSFKRVEFVFITILMVVAMSFTAVVNASDHSSNCGYLEEPPVSSQTQKNDDDCYVQFAKVWEGDEIDESEVTVTFTGQVKESDFSWTLGVDAPVMVVPGRTTVNDLDETVTGLPENCSYTTDLPKSITAPVEGYDEDGVYTVVVTNTVECEEDEEVPVTPVVAQVTATPVGPVNTGTGSNLTAPLVGLFGSLALVAGGLVARKRSLQN